MADTFTPNLNLDKPEIGASADTWGTKTNANWDVVDALFAVAGNGTVIRRNAAGNAAVGPGVDLTAAAGTARSVNFYSGTLLRWQFVATPTPESGSNAGCDFVLGRFTDAGAFIDNPLAFVRSTGVGTFSQIPQVGTSPIITQATLATANASLAEPVGTVKMYCGTADPPAVSGVQYFMLCDGRPISRTTFAALFTAIGTQYGAGDGSTTFNIPNTAERVVIGHSAAQTLIPQFDCRAMGNSFGEGRHTQLTAEVGSHTHGITDPKHHHTLASSLNAAAGGSGLTPGAGAGVTSDELTNITINASPAAAPMNVVQPSLVMNFIIRVQ